MGKNKKKNKKKAKIAPQMSFDAALRKLGIEDFKTRIITSNSKGELMHLTDYIVLAESLPDDSNFRAWFLSVVKYANKNWNRPKSVYQHMVTLFKQSLKQQVKEEQDA